MSYETKNIRNIALLGHGNNGKTSLAESMLYVTGAIDRLGKVADGNTVCDYDAEEIARQITIATSIAPVSYDGCKINVLDCPGFFDFVGDALCALRAVEAGMIVTSAKDAGESIPVGAQRCWNYLKAASLPVMFTISKCNEEHGDYFKALETLKGKYGSIVCPVTIPTSDGTGVIDLVHNVAYITKGSKTEKGAVPAADADHVEELRAELMEAAAGATEELMEKFFETMELEEADIVEGLKAGMKDRSVVPVFASDAMTNVGTVAMLQGIADYCHAPVEKNDGVTGFVFKTVSDKFGKFSFVKVVSGKITAGMSLYNLRASSNDKLGRMYTMCGKKSTEVTEACCGDIVAVGKLFVQIRLQAQIACFPGNGHVVAVIGKKVEVGKSGVLLCFLDIGLNLCFVRGIFQKAVVQMQIGQVFAHHLLQHIVGFMQHLFQMRGAFLIDGLRHKRDVSDAETGCQQNQKKDGGGREPLLPGMAVSFGFVFFVCHSGHLNVM